MQTIGLEALFQDKDFQAGVARYLAGLARVEGATQKSASLMTAFGHTISTAIGTALGMLSAQAIPNLINAVMAPINVMQQWGGQLDELGDLFGVNDEAATGMSVAFAKVGMSVEEGSSGLNAFIRNAESAKDAMSGAGASFGESMREMSAAHTDALAELGDSWRTQQQEAAESLAAVWADFAERRAEIEADLADRIAEINDSLNERLGEIAEDRAKLERDTAKSLAKVDEDTKDRLRNARSARDRRQIKKDAAERKKEILEEAAERRAELDKQEARAREQAAKQIALAEKVAAKQIAAAEKAAQKQAESIEKALAKQEAAYEKQAKKEEERYQKQIKQQEQQMAKAGASNPFLKALKELGLSLEKVTDESRPFEERLGDIMEAFKKLPAGIKASNIAMQLFGRSGTKYLDFLRMGREGLEAMKKEGIELGLVLNPDEVKAYSQEMSLLGLRLDALSINIGKAILPLANQFVVELSGVVKQVMPIVTDLLNKVAEGFRKDGLNGAIAALKTWVDDPVNKKRIDDAMTKISGVLSTIWAAIVGTTRFVSEMLNALFDAVGRWASTAEGQASIKWAAYYLGNALSDALTWFVNTSGKILEFLGALAGRMLEWATTEPGSTQLARIGEAMANAVIVGFSNWFNNHNPFKNLPGYGKEPYENNPPPPKPNPMQGTYPPREYQHGGWVDRTGAIFAHAGEYVLNRQQAMAWVPALTRPNMTTNQYNFSHVWNGAPASFDRREVEQIAEEAAYRGVSRLLPGR